MSTSMSTLTTITIATPYIHIPGTTSLGCCSDIYLPRSVVVITCNTITFQSVDYKVLWTAGISWDLRGYGSRSYMKVIGSRSRSRQEKVRNSVPYSRSVKLQSAVTPVPQKTEPRSLRIHHGVFRWSRSNDVTATFVRWPIHAFACGVP